MEENTSTRDVLPKTADKEPRASGRAPWCRLEGSSRGVTQRGMAGDLGMEPDCRPPVVQRAVRANYRARATRKSGIS